MSEALALLVDAATAQSRKRAPKEVNGSRARAANAKKAKGRFTKNSSVNTPVDMKQDSKVYSTLPALTTNSGPTQVSQREAFARERMERQIMQERRAMIGGYNGLAGGLGSLHEKQLQEREYLQRMRLEALVQQRRQEALSQFSFAQKMGMYREPNPHSNLDQLRKEAILRQEMLFTRSSPTIRDLIPDRQAQGKELVLDEELRKQKYFEQQQLARRQAVGSDLNAKLLTAISTSKHGFSKGTTANAKVNTAIGQDGSFKIVPCKARGLPKDHNEKTACFQIPKDMKHGSQLVCSYFACRNSGARFRFCTTCKMPVSKWNFDKLHSHKKEIAGEAEKVLEELIEMGAKEVTVAETAADDRPKKMTAAHKKRYKDRQSAWDRLLTSRPKSKASLKVWVQQALKVSDLSMDSSSSNDSEKKVARKRKLKHALPINGHAKKGKVSKTCIDHSVCSETSRRLEVLLDDVKGFKSTNEKDNACDFSVSSDDSMELRRIKPMKRSRKS